MDRAFGKEWPQRFGTRFGYPGILEKQFFEVCKAFQMFQADIRYGGFAQLQHLKAGHVL